MAIRNIRIMGDAVLAKECRPITEMNRKLEILIEDMLDTMYSEGGVGLAAPQVGILKQLAVIDVSEEGNSPIVLINPEIIETDGANTDEEGCLSLPGKAGKVTRPNYVKVRSLTMDMQEAIYEGTELLARAFCHEIDHLHGKTYVSLVEGGLHDAKQEQDGQGQARGRRGRRKKK